jgi:hypothetical protein
MRANVLDLDLDSRVAHGKLNVKFSMGSVAPQMHPKDAFCVSFYVYLLCILKRYFIDSVKRRISDHTALPSLFRQFECASYVRYRPKVLTNSSKHTYEALFEHIISKFKQYYFLYPGIRARAQREVLLL